MNARPWPRVPDLDRLVRWTESNTSIHITEILIVILTNIHWLQVTCILYQGKERVEVVFTRMRSVCYPARRPRLEPTTRDPTVWPLSYRASYKQTESDNLNTVVYSRNYSFTNYYSVPEELYVVYWCSHTSYILMWVSSDAVHRSCESGENARPRIGIAWPVRQHHTALI